MTDTVAPKQVWVQRNFLHKSSTYEVNIKLLTIDRDNKTIQR